MTAPICHEYAGKSACLVPNFLVSDVFLGEDWEHTPRINAEYVSSIAADPDEVVIRIERGHMHLRKRDNASACSQPLNFSEPDVPVLIVFRDHLITGICSKIRSIQQL